MTTKKSTRRPAVQTHHYVSMSPPLTAIQKRPRLPFTEKVMAMPADPGTALVYDRREEKLNRVSGLCGSAVRCVVRHGRDKEFLIRYVEVDGIETYAVWRMK